MSEKKYPRFPVLLVDDEQIVLDNYNFALYAAGIDNFTLCGSGAKVLPELQRHSYSVVVLDLMMPEMSGKELLSRINDAHPNLPVIIITAIDDVTTAVECMKSGAFDYLTKPVENRQLFSTIERALYDSERSQEINGLRESIFTDNIEDLSCFSKIITRSKTMYPIFRYVNGIARTSFPVLITGETGTGKELLAESIHLASGRTGAFVPLNSAGIESHLLEDTLFGHVKGAFTGADKAREGLIAKAENGTLFLDEISEVSPAVQIKLLRFLQERTYYPLGADQARHCDVRIVTATNRHLSALRESEHFRNDLFYRLQTHSLQLPPLRERESDIGLLVEHFIRLGAHETGCRIPVIPAGLIPLLESYRFPGNIRELESMVYDAVAQCGDAHKIPIALFKSRIGLAEEPSPSKDILPEQEVDDKIIFPAMLPPLSEVEHIAIREALRRSDNNQTAAAELLCISRKALNSRLSRMKGSI